MDESGFLTKSVENIAFIDGESPEAVGKKPSRPMKAWPHPLA